MLDINWDLDRMNNPQSDLPPQAPEPDIFPKADGLLVLKQFLEKPLCARLLAEANAASVMQAKVFKRADAYFVATDEGARKTKLAGVAGATRALVQQRLLAAKPIFERHFNVALSGCEQPQFLSYGKGDFFKPHYDGIPDSSPAAEFAYLHARRVSVVLFLNDQSEAGGPETYRGGALRFYGPGAFGSLARGERRLRVTLRPKVTHELRGEAGMLVAFRPNLLHEVEVVRDGGRHTIVSWFF